jgi:hypothetical protein
MADSPSKFTRRIIFIGRCFLKASDTESTWSDRLTPLGVPLLIAGVLSWIIGQLHLRFDLTDVPWSFAVLFVVCRAFWNTSGRYDELSEKQKPVFGVECDSSLDRFHDERPIKWTTGSGHTYTTQGTFFKMAVSVPAPNTVKNCKITVVRIERDGEELLKGRPLEVNFSYGNDESYKRDVSNGIPESVDVICIEGEGARVPISNKLGATFLPAQFAEAANFTLAVVVSGEGVRSKDVLLNFNWTRDAKTSRLVCIP